MNWGNTERIEVAKETWAAAAEEEEEDKGQEEGKSVECPDGNNTKKQKH